MQIIFDPDLGIRRALEVSSYEDWEYIARRNIYGYKHENVFAQEEHWYQERVDRWHNLPGFPKLWQEVDLEFRHNI